MIFFIHVPKTGGMSVGQSFNQHSNAVRTLYWEQHGERVEQLDGDYDLVFGHVPFERVRVPARFVTVVRHPVDLIVSQYWYWQNAARYERRVGPWYAHYDPIRRQMPLDEFVAILDAHQQQNDLDGDVPGWPIGRIPSLLSWHLRGADLGAFELVGHTAELSKFHRALGALLGAQPPLRLDHTGMRPDGMAQSGKTHRPNLDRAMVARIEQLCAQDMETYAAARRHLI